MTEKEDSNQGEIEAKSVSVVPEHFVTPSLDAVHTESKVGLLNSRTLVEMNNDSLFASIKATDTNFQAVNDCQDITKYVNGIKDAEKYFKPDAYNHTIPGYNMYPQTFREWHCVNELGHVIPDEEFELFCREARFEMGRAGDKPSQKNVSEIVKYANEKRTEASNSQKWDPNVNN